MHDKEIKEAVSFLNELKEDTTVPKNIKQKLSCVVTILTSEGEESMKVNKALNELDEISNDSNVEPYTRTQIWNVVSLLEKV